MRIEDILFSLLRMEICGGTLNGNVKEALTAEVIEDLFRLSKRHDLAHITGHALEKLGVLQQDEISTKLRQQTMLAFYRYVQMNYEYECICKTLEDAQFPFIPLKGSVLRVYYPEPWMRTSCDIDILVYEEDLDRAASVLVEKLDYKRGEKDTHDISMFSPSGVHFELHYTAIEEHVATPILNVLERFWDHAKSIKEGSFHYGISDEMFYFFHISHMAKHLENGGCGIRPFVDLWILNHRIAHDRNKRDLLLAEGGLLTFARAAEKLSEVWFSGTEADALSWNLERYILDGGVYGTLKNAVAVKQTQKGGKLQYALMKIFPSYDYMKYYYPVLQKHRWLTPLYHIVRWCRLVFKECGKRAIHEFKINAEISKEEFQTAADLMKHLGL